MATKIVLTEEEQAVHAQMCELMDCPLTGPEPVADLFDVLAGLRKKRQQPANETEPDR